MTKRMFSAGITPAQLAEMTRHRCAWKDCRNTTPTDKPLPPDWRWLALWPDFGDPLKLPEFREVLAHADRDCVLCPHHAAQLHFDLLEDIGQRLNKTEGNA